MDSQKNLPKNIADRLYLDEHAEPFEELDTLLALNDSTRQQVYEYVDSILSGSQKLHSLVSTLQKITRCSEEVARMGAAILIEKYFYLFQDVVGPCAEILKKLGGSTVHAESRARAIFAPHRLLRSRIAQFLNSFALNPDDESHYKFIAEILLDRAQGRIDVSEIEKKLENFYRTHGIIGSVKESALKLEYQVVSGAFTRKDAEYILSYAEKILGAQPVDEPIHDVSKSMILNDPYSRRQKFELLPERVKNTLLSSQEASQKRKEIEKRYGVALEEVIFSAAIGDFPLFELAIMIKKECGVDKETASAIRDEVMTVLFNQVMDYFTPPDTSLRDSGESQAAQVLRSASITLSSSLVARFEKLYATRMRGLRNAIDVRELFSASPDGNGLGLSATDAVRLSDAVERAVKGGASTVEKAKTVEVKQSSATLPAAPVQQPTVEPITVQAPIVSAEPVATPPQKEEIKKEQSTPALSIEDVDGVPTLVEKSAAVKQLRPTPVSVPRQNVPVEPVMATAPHGAVPLKVRTTGDLSPNTKKTVQPVLTQPSIHPRLVDSVEELRILSLTDFRRIAQSPQEAAQKIGQKILSMEKESYEKKTAAIDAWRASEVNALYLGMGQESFEKGLSLTQVIDARKSSGQLFLTETEFDAILELNEMVRF